MQSNRHTIDKERYKRNLMLPEIGEQGQMKLMSASVLVIGAGGIGSPVIAYLAAAGVGSLGIVDGDKVELSNLQRQFLHSTASVGINKAQSAQRFVSELNPEVKVEVYPFHLSQENAQELIAKYDFVVIATDNFASRKLVNRICVEQKKPYSLGAISGMNAQVMTHVPGTACYSCLFGDEPTDTDAQVGVLGAAVGLLGTIQATETIKYFIGAQLLVNQILIIDVLSMSFQKISVERNGQCNVCGGK